MFLCLLRTIEILQCKGQVRMCLWVVRIFSQRLPDIIGGFFAAPCLLAQQAEEIVRNHVAVVEVEHLAIQ
jgi:hypothetical protein